MNLSISKVQVRTRMIAIFMLLAAVISTATGMMPAVSQNNGWGKPTYAAGVDDLWGEVKSDNGQVSVGGGLNQSTTDLGTVVNKGQEIARAISGILTLVCFVALLIMVTKLATSAGNPQSRRTAIAGILVSGIALALFGGAWVVTSFFWNLLN